MCIGIGDIVLSVTDAAAQPPRLFSRKVRGGTVYALRLAWFREDMHVVYVFYATHWRWKILREEFEMWHTIISGFQRGIINLDDVMDPFAARLLVDVNMRAAIYNMYIKWLGREHPILIISDDRLCKGEEAEIVKFALATIAYYTREAGIKLPELNDFYMMALEMKEVMK